MSLSPFDSFQSRFVTYLLNRPRSSTVLEVERLLKRHLVLQHVMKTYGTSNAQTVFLKLGARWSRMVSFAPRPLFNHGGRYNVLVEFGWSRRFREKSLMPFALCFIVFRDNNTWDLQLLTSVIQPAA